MLCLPLLTRRMTSVRIRDSTREGRFGRSEAGSLGFAMLPGCDVFHLALGGAGLPSGGTVGLMHRHDLTLNTVP